ncbi:fimbrial biogenesis outer membrane usher protein [Achromobacter sp. SD115]|uniref:fimbria/pilus outer membrane usher protein n=1 Tax=Achromobacter sp. SD115 TaxID=2782011 RepID=UPI001A975E4E|nr:fimbria/pilus outer membrane usher protein [Achromobacter sp. SD115]MBO1014523.1 fimbrial biogenesis outer membrane usher protein [Achromobacter sp. SD115]
MIGVSQGRMPPTAALASLLLGLASFSGQAAEPTGTVFNQEFLGTGGDQPQADLSIFSFGNSVLPGEYLADVFVNDQSMGRSRILIETQEGQKQPSVCLTRSQLETWGVNMAALPESAGADGACVDLPALVQDAAVSFDGGKQRLHLSIPQAALKRSARDSVDPSRWDKGITSGLLDYQLNMSRQGGENSSSRGAESPYMAYAGLRGGLNFGDWRLRHASNYNRGSNGRGEWQSLETNLQRDLRSINGQLLLGDGYTPGNFFDSVPFRGVQVYSDDSMLPDSMQGYAPTIRGIAQTNALVTVRQNGYIVYNAYVAPGAFVLDDLYPSSSGGDLEVTITESDGRQNRYVQAYASVPTLLREGTWRYSATAGRYRNAYGSNEREPTFLQGTAARGLVQEFSLYGGVTAASIYQSGVVGVGKNLRSFGAVSLDLTHARTSTERLKTQGQSIRFLYAKSLEESGTNFSLAGYRYSTSGYRTFRESTGIDDFERGSRIPSRRNELRFDVNQSLGSWGSIYATARQQSYWQTNQKERMIQVAYAGSYRQVSYNVMVDMNTGVNSSRNRRVMLSLSIPLGASRSSATYSLTTGNNGETSHAAAVSGSALEDNQLTYHLTATTSNQNGANSTGDASYLSRIGRFDLGASQGRNFNQINAGLSGGIVVHAGGVTLGQPLGETVALVRAPSADNVRFESHPGVSTNASGYAIVPSLSPYRSNRLAMRTADLGDTIEVRNAAVNLVPTRGAVIQAGFETVVGYRLMMTLTRKDNSVVPFGARIDNEAGEEIGIVGPDGQAFVTGARQSGTMRIVWGRGASDSCGVSYRLPEEDRPTPIREVSYTCL